MEPISLPHLPLILSQSLEIDPYGLSNPEETVDMINKVVQVATITYGDRDPQFSQVLTRVSEVLQSAWTVHEELLFQKLCSADSGDFSLTQSIIDETEAALDQVKKTINNVKTCYNRATEMAQQIVEKTQIDHREAMKILEDQYSVANTVWGQIDHFMCLLEKVRTENF